jgi:hypothetical protein
MDVIEHRIARTVKELRKRGLLVDVTDEAQSAGVPFRFEVSLRLWTSVFWQYPSAGAEDLVSLDALLRELARQIQSDGGPKKSCYYVRPPVRPWWLEKRYLFNAVVTYRARRVKSITLMADDEAFCSVLSFWETPLPAALLTNLLVTSRDVLRVGNTLDQSLFRSIHAAIQGLLAYSPVRAEIIRFANRPKLTAPAERFSTRQYRQVLLQSLLHQIQLAAAVADKTNARLLLPAGYSLRMLADLVSFVPLDPPVEESDDEPRLH